MGGTFNIQKVEVLVDRLVVRCVREFFYEDGLMSDDVWIWEIEQPEEGNAALLRAMIGKQCYVGEDSEGKSLLVDVEESDESIAVRGKRIGKKVEPRGPQDLEDVIAQLSREIGREVTYHAVLHRKLREIATFVEHKIDNIQRRSEFVKLRKPAKSEALGRELEDLQTILRKLKDSNRNAETAPSSVR